MSRWDLPAADLPFVSFHWQKMYAHLTSQFPENEWPPVNFLVPFFEHTGFFVGDLDMMERELAQIQVPDGIEPSIPRVYRGPVRYDPTTVHHLFDLHAWRSVTGVDLKTLDRVVEWGAGFGSLARLVLGENPELEYTMIDLPLMRAVQSQYLDLCGLQNAPTRWRSPSESADLHGDLFIATWSLNESSEYAQRWVFDRDFFRCRHVLLEFASDSPLFEDSYSFGARLPGDLTIVESEADGFYAFR